MPIERDADRFGRSVGSCRARDTVGGNSPSVSTRRPRSAATFRGDRPKRRTDRRPSPDPTLPGRGGARRRGARASGSVGRHEIVLRRHDVGSAGVRLRLMYAAGLPATRHRVWPAEGRAVGGRSVPVLAIASPTTEWEGRRRDRGAAVPTGHPPGRSRGRRSRPRTSRSRFRVRTCRPLRWNGSARAPGARGLSPSILGRCRHRRHLRDRGGPSLAGRPGGSRADRRCSKTSVSRGATGAATRRPRACRHSRTRTRRDRSRALPWRVPRVRPLAGWAARRSFSCPAVLQRVPWLGAQGSPRSSRPVVDPEPIAPGRIPTPAEPSGARGPLRPEVGAGRRGQASRSLDRGSRPRRPARRRRPKPDHAPDASWQARRRGPAGGRHGHMRPADTAAEGGHKAGNPFLEGIDRGIGDGA